MAFNRLSLIKLVEFLLVLACVYFHYHSLEGVDKMHLFFVSGVFGGYLIIMIGLILGFFVDTAFGRRADMYFTVLGGVLFLAAGFICYQEFYNRTFNTGNTRDGQLKTWAAIINGILFLVDGTLTYRIE